MMADPVCDHWEVAQKIASYRMVLGELRQRMLCQSTDPGTPLQLTAAYTPQYVLTLRNTICNNIDCIKENSAAERHQVSRSVLELQRLLREAEGHFAFSELEQKTSDCGLSVNSAGSRQRDDTVREPASRPTGHLQPDSHGSQPSAAQDRPTSSEGVCGQAVSVTAATQSQRNRCYEPKPQLSSHPAVGQAAEQPSDEQGHQGNQSSPTEPDKTKAVASRQYTGYSLRNSRLSTSTARATIPKHHGRRYPSSFPELPPVAELKARVKPKHERIWQY